MAVKNWLIRTKNKQILGPATKQKVIELVEKGSLTQEDEISCGNGYWFWIRERELLEKYLYGDLPQTFNPISEAKDVLTAKSTPDGITASAVESPQKAQAKSEDPDVNKLPQDDDLVYPDAGDLSYPDMGEAKRSDVTAVDSNLVEQPQEPKVDPAETAEIKVEETIEEPAKPSPPAPSQEPQSVQVGDENFLYPPPKDLEYPEIPGAGPEADATGEVEVPNFEQDEDRTDPNVTIPETAELQEEPEEVPHENTMEMATPEEELGMASPPVMEELEDEPIAPAKNNSKKTGKKKSSKEGQKKRRVIQERKGNDRYLIYIGVIIAIIIGVVIYYYTTVLNKPFPVIGLSEAQAQTIQSLSKKKTFLR